MSETTKRLSEYDQTQIMQKIYNPDGSIAVGSFLAGKIGHKVERTAFSATVDDYEFFDGSTLLYTIRVTYNNSSHDEIDSAERIV
jgi:hypothetical protein